MPRGINASPLAFYDVKQLLDDAIMRHVGKRVVFKSAQEARKFLSRIYSYRRGDRLHNRKHLPDNHPMYGLSEYDRLTFVMPEPHVLEVKFYKINAEITDIDPGVSAEDMGDDSSLL